MKNIAISLLKCFLYVIIMGICQVISSSLVSEDVLLSTFFGDIIFVVVAIIMVKFLERDVKERLRFNKITLKTAISVVIIALVFNILFQSVQFLFPMSMRAELFNQMDNELGDIVGVIGFITTVIVAPLSEEVLFRGLILGELTKCFNVHIAIILQAVLFGVMHGNIIWATIAFLSAVLYGYFVKKYKSIFTSVLGHMSVNLLSFIISG